MNVEPKSFQNLGPREIAIYTDGACSGNPGSAGLGVLLIIGKDLIPNGPLACAYARHIAYPSTNNKAELTAIKVALEEIITLRSRRRMEGPDTVYLYSDSTYALKSIAGHYRPFKNTWLIDSGKELVKYADYKLRFFHIRAHRGHEWNEAADVLAKTACADDEMASEELFMTEDTLRESIQKLGTK